MSRKHANLHTDIWNDPDFRALTAQAQLLYIQMLSSATLTYAGVADWRPKRIALLSKGRTAREVEDALEELLDGLFLVVDEESEEVFVRSFFKWDGLLRKPNVTKAMVKAWDKVHSLTLKAVIVHELQRLRSQFPEWPAFVAGVVDELCERDSLDPREVVAGRVPGRVSERDAERNAPLLTTNYLLPTTGLPATDSAPSAQEIESLFDQAYSRWPKKAERKKSLEKFKQACRKRDPDELVADIIRFGDAYAATTDVQYVPALVVWLNGERWTDALPQPRRRDTGPTRAEQAWEFVNGGEIGVQGNEAAVRGYLEQ